MKKTLALLLAFAALTLSLQAQFRVAGKVYNSADGTPCAYSNVIVLKDTASLNAAVLLSAMSDSLGRYVLALPAGTYTLKASLVGYKTGYFRLTVGGDQADVNLALKEEGNTLSEAVVSAQLIKDKGNHFEVAVADNPLLSHEMMIYALDLIPGMDGLSVYGRPISTVYVNGRQLKGVNPETYLRTLPTEMVEKIEVYPFGAVEFGGDGAVMRVKLKRQRDGVVLGNLAPDIAFHRKGITNLELTSALTFSVGKWSSLTTFDATEHPDTRYDPNDIEVEKTYFGEGTVYHGSANGKAATARTYTIDESLFYDINDKHQLSLGFSTEIIPKYVDNSYETYDVDYRSVLSAFSKSRVLSEDWNQFKFDIYGQYLWTIDEFGSDLQFSLDYLQQKSDIYQPDSVTYDWHAELEGDTLLREMSVKSEDGTNRTFSPAIDGHWAINEGKGGQISYGAKYILTTQELVRDFRSSTNGGASLRNESLSADYFYREGITKVYASYGRQLADDKFYFTVGANYRNYYSSFTDHLAGQRLSRTYNTVEPMLFWQWKIKKHNVNYYNLSLSLSTSATLNNARDLYTNFDRSSDKEITFSTGKEKTSRTYAVTLNSNLTKRFTITTGAIWNTNVNVYRTYLQNDTVFNEITQNGDYFRWEFNGSYQDYVVKNLYLTLGGTAHAEVRRWEYGEPYKPMWWYSVYTSLRWRAKKWLLAGGLTLVSKRTTPSLYHRPLNLTSNFSARYSFNKKLSLTLQGNATLKKSYNRLNTATYSITQGRRSSASFFLILNWTFGNNAKKKVNVEALDRNSDAQERNE